MRYRSVEQGRSMVEMLGTLAIMGVLSVGAIAGFNYAMNKHRANELLEEARKRAYTVMTQTQLGLTRSLGEYSRYNTFAGGTFASEIVTTGLRGQFGLKITGVKKPVCQRLLEAVNNNVILRWVATPEQVTVPLTTCSDIGDYVLVYNNDMTGKETDPEYCQSKSDCASACDDCIDGVCQENCAAGEQCVYRPTGRQKATDKTMCCPAERVMNGICCVSVITDETGKKYCCPTTDTTTCCPENYFYVWNDGKCHNCEDQKSYTEYGHIDKCAICENRFKQGWMCSTACDGDQIQEDNVCYCPEDKPIVDTKGHCHACSESISGWEGTWLSSTQDIHYSEVCFSVAKCGNFVCPGSYVNKKCENGQIAHIRYNYGEPHFKLKDGSDSYGCHDCSDVDISTIVFESQCRICGGTWSGSNWYTGTCTPGAKE